MREVPEVKRPEGAKGEIVDVGPAATNLGCRVMSPVVLKPRKYATGGDWHVELCEATASAPAESGRSRTRLGIPGRVRVQFRQWRRLAVRERFGVGGQPAVAPGRTRPQSDPRGGAPRGATRGTRGRPGAGPKVPNRAHFRGRRGLSPERALAGQHLP